MSTAILERELNADSCVKYYSGIRKVLYDLAIDPFYTDTVKEYKNKELAKYKWRNKVRATIESVFDKIFCICLVSIIATSFWATAAFSLWVKGVISTELTVISTLPVFAVTTAVFMVGLSLNWFANNLKVAEWRSMNIDEYKHPIPEFVLQTVADIKEKMGNQYCRFSIDALLLEKRPCDPFLVVHTFEGSFYIEVWNESYQKQRMV